MLVHPRNFLVRLSRNTGTQILPETAISRLTQRDVSIMMREIGCGTLWYGNQDVGSGVSNLFWFARPETG